MSAKLDKLAFDELIAISRCTKISVEHFSGLSQRPTNPFEVIATNVGSDCGSSIADAAIKLLEYKSRSLFEQIADLEEFRLQVNTALANIKRAEAIEKKLEDEAFEAAEVLNANNPKISEAKDD